MKSKYLACLKLKQMATIGCIYGKNTVCQMKWKVQLLVKQMFYHAGQQNYMH